MGSTLVPPRFERPLTPDAPQYLHALDAANRVRCERSAIKRRLATQPTRRQSLMLCVELVSDPPEALAGMPLEQLLLACRRVGQHAARRVMTACQIGSRRELRDLTQAERQRLISALRMMP